MRATSTLSLVVTAVAFGLTALMGDDADQKRGEAAEWCEVTLRLDDYFDDTDGMRAISAQIAYDTAAEWIDVAPSDIRESTERAARIMRDYSLLPRVPIELAHARKDIAAYAAEYCEAPAPCIEDVDGNSRLPCIHPIETRRGR